MKVGNVILLEKLLSAVKAIDKIPRYGELLVVAIEQGLPVKLLENLIKSHPDSQIQFLKTIDKLPPQLFETSYQKILKQLLVPEVEVHSLTDVNELMSAAIINAGDNRNQLYRHVSLVTMHFLIGIGVKASDIIPRWYFRFFDLPAEDQVYLISSLLNAGAPINKVSWDRELSPLTLSIRYDSPEVTEFLLQRGADYSRAPGVIYDLMYQYINPMKEKVSDRMLDILLRAAAMRDDFKSILTRLRALIESPMGNGYNNNPRFYVNLADYEERVISIMSKLINAGYEFSILPTKRFSEELLIKIIESVRSLQKFPTQSGDVDLRLKGIYALFKYAVVNSYSCLVEKLLKLSLINVATLKESLSLAETTNEIKNRF